MTALEVAEGRDAATAGRMKITPALRELPTGGTVVLRRSFQAGGHSSRMLAFMQPMNETRMGWITKNA